MARHAALGTQLGRQRRMRIAVLRHVKAESNTTPAPPMCPMSPPTSMVRWPGLLLWSAGLGMGTAAEEVCWPMPPSLTPTEACDFIQHTCGHSAEYVYLAMYYCSDTWSTSVLASTAVHICVTLLLTVWLLVLFSVLGLVASDFFCPNLSSMATRWGLSDNVVGVTFLALGNASPDVVSTFRAMEKDAGSMALGEIMGAAVFTVAIVCGSIMVLHSFRIVPFVFVRDVGTYILAVALALYFMRDGSLSASEGMWMLGLYIVYIGTVILCDTTPKRTPEQEPLLPDATHAHHSVLSAMRVQDMTAHSEPDLASSVLPSPRSEHPSAEHRVDAPSTAAFDPSMARVPWRRIWFVALCPSLVHFSHKSWGHALASVAYAPALLVLRLTVPLVSWDEYQLHATLEAMQGAADEDAAQALRATVWDEAVAVLETPGPLVATSERVAADHFLLSVQCIGVPALILWMYDGPLYFAMPGTIASVCLWRHLRASPCRDAPEQLQRYALLRNVLGFFMGLLWIVASVDGILAVLRAYGYIYHWSEAVLGLTVFAWGNSLGDVVTNLSIARAGHPHMALTACFASPLTNMLFGVGFATTWLTLLHPTHEAYRIALSPALALSCIVMLGMLLVMLVAVSLHGCRTSRPLGYVLLVTYVGVMVGSIFLEFTHT